jgi:hypothetical protein
MDTERERKANRFSRWRERRRVEALRASEIKRELKAARAGKDPERHLRGSGGDGRGMTSKVAADVATG